MGNAVVARWLRSLKKEDYSKSACIGPNRRRRERREGLPERRFGAAGSAEWRVVRVEGAKQSKACAGCEECVRLANSYSEKQVSTWRLSAEDFVGSVGEPVALDGEGKPVGGGQTGICFRNELEPVGCRLGGFQQNIWSHGNAYNIYGRWGGGWRRCNRVDHVDVTAEFVDCAVIDAILGVCRNLEGYCPGTAPVGSTDTRRGPLVDLGGNGEGMVACCVDCEGIRFASYQRDGRIIVHPIDQVGELIIGGGDGKIRGLQTSQTTQEHQRHGENPRPGRSVVSPP